jgi:trimeric autotransporter adhesin
MKTRLSAARFLSCTSLFLLCAVIGCGGGSSGNSGAGSSGNSGGGSASNPLPNISSLSPTSAPISASGTDLTVSGSGFVSASQVLWNKSAVATTFVSATSLTAAIPAASLAAAGTASITVSNPSPGGGTSSAISFNITNPVPVLTAISPASVTAGSSATTLTLTGSNFVSSAQVEWNGATLSTTYVSATSLTAVIPTANLAATSLTATIPAADFSGITASTTATIQVMNPTPGGGASNSLPFDINTPANHITEISTPVNHIVWDATQSSLYATLPSTGANANTVVAINPVTATLGTPVAAGNTPDLLALSTDDSFLYVSLDGTPSIVRFNLPALTLDSSFNLPVPTSNIFGAQTAISIAVAPGSPHTIAAIFGQPTTSGPNTGGTWVYDDATARASSVTYYNESDNSLVWGGTAATLYGADTLASPNSFYVNTVNSTGVTLSQSYNEVVSSRYGTIHFDAHTGHVYADGGNVVDPATGNLLGTFNLQSVVATPAPLCTPDTANNVVFFLGQTTTQFNVGSGVTVLAFNATTYQLLATLPVNGISGFPIDFVRWGNAGLAFTMMPNWHNVPIQSGPIYLLDGSFVSPSATPDFITGASVDPLPNLGAISPQSAAAGSPAVTLSVTGSNFQSGASVLWNGTPLETSVTSASALQATIPPSALAATGTAVVTVTNGSDGSSVGSLAFTITPAASGTTNLMAVNLASLDIAWDSAATQLIAPVWSADPQYPNSIVAINPATGAVTSSASVSADPTMARITSDGSYVYTGFKAVNQVTQLALPGLGAPTSFSLGADSFTGPWYALDLQPAPGASLTTAITLGTNGQNPPQGSLGIYDSGVQRTTVAPGFGPTTDIFNDLQWGANASTLYADDNYSSLNFYTLAVNSSGVTLTSTTPNAFGAIGSKMHFDSTTGYIYDENGQVINPATATQVGTFGASGLLVADDTLGRVFILGQTTAQSGTANYTIQSFNQTTFTAVGSISITGVVGTPVALTRWGANGLAFVTYNKNASPTTGPFGMLYILSDTGFVSANRRAFDATKFAPVHGVPSFTRFAGNTQQANPAP